MIRETTALGGWLAAEVLDVPGASWEFNRRTAAVRVEVMDDLFQAARAEVGLAPEKGLGSADPGYAAAARDLAAGTAEMPPFTDAARLLEQLATHRQPILTD